MKNFVGTLNPVLRSLAKALPPGNPIRQWASKTWKKILTTTNSDVQVRLNGELTWVSSFWRSLDPDYEKEVVQSFVRHVQPGNVVWDIGANIGLFSILAARRVGSTGKVFAWEPSPLSFDYLNHHLKINELDSRVLCIQEAIHEGPMKEVVFQMDYQNESSPTNRFSYQAKDAAHSEIKVRCRSIDEWMKTLPAPDVVKMDIEGAEVFALRGGNQLFSGAFGKKPKILLAIHPASIDQYGESSAELERVVKSYGYRLEKARSRAVSFEDFGETWLIPV